MPNLVKSLDQSRAYVLCPVCRQNGNPDVPMTRNMHLFICPFQHSLSWQQLEGMGADMEKMEGTVVVEQPNANAMAYKIYMMPATWAAINKKFAGRLHATLGVFMDLLADDSVVLITGPDAVKLKLKGLNTSAQIVAALESSSQMEKERDEAVANLEKFQNLLRKVTS